MFVGVVLRKDANEVAVGAVVVSVAMAIADVFSKNGYTVPNKIAKILRIFDGLETPKSRWVISLH